MTKRQSKTVNQLIREFEKVLGPAPASVKPAKG
jgi:hypothetical protein